MNRDEIERFNDTKEVKKRNKISGFVFFYHFLRLVLEKGEKMGDNEKLPKRL